MNVRRALLISVTARLWSTALILFLTAFAGLWFALVRSQQGRAVPVLMYHNLVETPDTEDVWAVGVAEFEGHLRSLRDQGYRSILPEDLVAASRWGRPLPRKPVIITFDDGLQNVLRLGEPLLRRYGYRAIAYLIADRPAEAPEFRKVYRGDPCLTWPEVAGLARRGVIAVGSHGLSHSRRSNVTASEAQGSRQLLRERTGEKIGDFCYPFGSHPPALVAAVRKAGYRTAMICDDDVAVWRRRMDLLRIPRVSVYGGMHRLEIRRVDPRPEEGSDVVFEGSNGGLPIPIAPVLLVDGRAHPYAGSPLPRLGPDPQRWRWPQAAVEGATEPPRVELWDTHRVLKLYP